MHIEPDWEMIGWEYDDGGDDRNRMLATLWVSGCPCHLEAIAVTDDEGIQQAVQPDMEQSLNAASEIAGHGGPFQTMTYEGREYVIVATSFLQ